MTTPTITDDEILSLILRREGSSYVADPDDRGVCSKWGITRDTLGDWRGVAATCDDVRNLSKDEACRIYQAKYLTPFGFVRDGSLRDLIVDCAVHHGPGRAIRWLQQALQVGDDGIVGEETKNAMWKMPVDAVYAGVLKRRLQFLGRLISEDPTQARFAAGWLKRVSEFV